MLREKQTNRTTLFDFYFDQNLQISYYCQTFLFTQHVKHTLFNNIMLTILIQCLTKVTTEQPLEKRHTTLFIHNFLCHQQKATQKKHTAEILFAYDLVWPWLSYNDALYCFKLLWFKIGHAFNGGSLSLCVCCVWNVNELLSDDCCLGQWLFFFGHKSMRTQVL